MASDDSDQDARYALSKLLQRETVAEYERFKVVLQIELLRARPTTLGEAFSLARARTRLKWCPIPIQPKPGRITTRLKEIIDQIMDSDMKLVIQKTLFESDLKRSQNKLMPFKQVETHAFLTDEKIRFLGRKNEDAEIEVRLTNWCDFVEANKKVLKEKETIQVWSFRKDEQLCFAVVRVDEPVVNTTFTHNLHQECVFIRLFLTLPRPFAFTKMAPTHIRLQNNGTRTLRTSALFLTRIWHLPMPQLRSFRFDQLAKLCDLLNKRAVDLLVLLST
ncbi:B3 domain-containing protein, DNA-binding pseudobarrel domain protein [Tanacetum coccineum]